ncbi:MAG: type II secretion system protein [Sulfurovum sp.]|nr:type II secretion system protein [Sulfurovum sp.]MBT8349161.1 type II secretion system protein [Sulfurovum sp.]NNJ45733.1 type II secretion system protein [Sulfurovum sp.]
MRKAFSMLTAIIVIILMATVAAFIMNLSGKMVKGTMAQFQREQSMLLAKSYTEFAIMAVTANEHNTSNCLNNISGSYGIFNVDVNISYIGNTDLDASCRILSNAVTNIKSPLNIVVDVFVSYDDLDNPSSPPPKITYHRRSLQKI